jgi:hypothetical protein
VANAGIKQLAKRSSDRAHNSVTEIARNEDIAKRYVERH